MRNFETNPYSPEEQRVADFLFNRGLGGGNDPIGFILASYEYAIQERNEFKEICDKLANRVGVSYGRI